MKKETGIMVQPYMPNEISKIYGISDVTMRTWLKRIRSKVGDRHGRYYTVKQVEIIFEEFGIPYRVVDSVVNASTF